MSGRRKRVLSREERWLWAKVANTYQPLKGKPMVLEPEDFSAPEPTVFKEAPKKSLPGLRPVVPQWKPAPPPKPERPKLPPLAPLERKTMRSVSRGVKPVDGVLDLHGMRQNEAHYALLSFLRQSQARGAVMVMVVTGKGDFESGFHRGPDERGVLKRVVPQWLSMPEARAYVVSFGEAAQHHGGTGALYVRLRRQRG